LELFKEFYATLDNKNIIFIFAVESSTQKNTERITLSQLLKRKYQEWSIEDTEKLKSIYSNISSKLDGIEFIPFFYLNEDAIYDALRDYYFPELLYHLNLRYPNVRITISESVEKFIVSKSNIQQYGFRNIFKTWLPRMYYIMNNQCQRANCAQVHVVVDTNISDITCQCLADSIWNFIKNWILET